MVAVGPACGAGLTAGCHGDDAATGATLGPVGAAGEGRGDEVQGARSAGGRGGRRAGAGRPGGRPRALLTALLLQPNAVVSTDRLVDARVGRGAARGAGKRVAAGRDPVAGPARLRSGLPASRRPAATGWPSAPARWTRRSSRPAYRRARTIIDAEPAEAARELDAALALWRGPAYGEFSEGFAQAPAVRLAELRTAAAEDRVELLLRRGAADRGRGRRQRAGR